MKNELASKDEIIFSQQRTILKKGKQNQKLSECVNAFKNTLIQEQIFDQKFLGVSQSKQLVKFQFVREKSETGEFYLEV